MKDDIIARYLTTVKAIGKLHETGKLSRQSQEKLDALQLQAASFFGQFYGWTLTRPYLEDGEPFLRALYPASKRPAAGEPAPGSSWERLRLFDHEFNYRDAEKLPVAIAAHIYDIHTHSTIDEVRAFAASHGLRARFLDLPSWWYPGRTTTLLWTREPEAAEKRAA